MWKDPIVADVRRARLEIEKECEDDFARIYARALEVQKKAAAKLVSPGADNNDGRDGLGDYRAIVCRSSLEVIHAEGKH